MRTSGQHPCCACCRLSSALEREDLSCSWDLTSYQLCDLEWVTLLVKNLQLFYLPLELLCKSPWWMDTTLLAQTPVTSFMHVRVSPDLHGYIQRRKDQILPSMEAWSESCSVMSDSLQPHGLYSPWNSPGHNTGEGSRSLLQGIFPTQGSNPGFPHCRWILYQLSH